MLLSLTSNHLWKSILQPKKSTRYHVYDCVLRNANKYGNCFGQSMCKYFTCTFRRMKPPFNRACVVMSHYLWSQYFFPFLVPGAAKFQTRLCNSSEPLLLTVICDTHWSTQIPRAACHMVTAHHINHEIEISDCHRLLIANFCFG